MGFLVKMSLLFRCFARHVMKSWVITYGAAGSVLESMGSRVGQQVFCFAGSFK